MINVTDATIDELHERALEVAAPLDRDFAVELVGRIDRQVVTIRDLFADVVRLSMSEETT